MINSHDINNIKEQAMIVINYNQALALSCLLQKALDNEDCDNQEDLQTISDNLDDAFIIDKELCANDSFRNHESYILQRRKEQEKDVNIKDIQLICPRCSKPLIFEAFKYEDKLELMSKCCFSSINELQTDWGLIN